MVGVEGVCGHDQDEDGTGADMIPDDIGGGDVCMGGACLLMEIDEGSGDIEGDVEEVEF